MKKTKILIGVGCLLGLFDNAMGAYCADPRTCCDSGTCITNGCYEGVPAAEAALRGDGFICENVRPNSTCTCIKNGSTTVYPMYCQTAVDCAPGYKCGANWECVWDDSGSDAECLVDADCESKADPWEEAYDPGFQVRTHLGCDDVCVETKYQDVRCIAGYWGQPDTPTEDDPMGCYPCPTLWGNAGLSINGAQYKTQCYIAAGSQIKDDTGIFEFTSDCYYTN